MYHTQNVSIFSYEICALHNFLFWTVITGHQQVIHTSFFTKETEADSVGRRHVQNQRNIPVKKKELEFC